MKIEVDQNTAVTFSGTHEGIRYSLSAHNFKDERRSSYDFEVMWATYIFLSEDMYEKFKPHLNDAPWNGGITFNQKHTHEHLDCPPELAEKWNKPFYKIGDDFSHLWDSERGGWSVDDKPAMKAHIIRVIDYLVDATKAQPAPTNPTADVKE